MNELDQLIDARVRQALGEDLGPEGDLTAQLVPEDAIGELRIVGREVGVVAGSACAICAFFVVDPTLEIDWLLNDGSVVGPGTVVATVTGAFRSILTAERTALNFLCHLSGVATATAEMVAIVHAANPKTKVLDTRKTTPGLRVLEKAAVVAGGGYNHRMSLSDAILIKDNHLGALSITDAVTRCRAIHPGTSIEVECDELDQVAEAVQAGAHSVLLDNMGPDMIRAAVALVRSLEGALPRIVEVSGGVTAATAASLAAAGADHLSVGALTHSAKVLDFGLDLARVAGENHAVGN